MKKIDFSKYHGAGNDFIIIDHRDISLDLSQEQISFLCHRHYGIGADGLILLEKDSTSDFKMLYFNSDGNESTMCGNGGRCIVQFAKDVALIDKTTVFSAIDGLHRAEIHPSCISLQMIDVQEIIQADNHYILQTGSPHYVSFIEDVHNLDVYTQGKAIRNSPVFAKEGINVNFVEIQSENELVIRTYERGVEDETLACGTGVTAAALAYAHQHSLTQGTISVKALGGDLSVSFEYNGSTYSNIWLKGPAQKVFEGTLIIE